MNLYVVDLLLIRGWWRRLTHGGTDANGHFRWKVAVEILYLIANVISPSSRIVAGISGFPLHLFLPLLLGQSNTIVLY